MKFDGAVLAPFSSLGSGSRRAEECTSLFIPIGEAKTAEKLINIGSAGCWLSTDYAKSVG